MTLPGIPQIRSELELQTFPDIFEENLPIFHYLRERTAYALAEYLIYKDPSVDADSLLAKMEHDVLGITHSEAPRWAAKTWYINYPIYWQNYVLADMVASQIHARLRQQYGSLHSQPAAFQEVIKTYSTIGALLIGRKNWLTTLALN